MKTFTFLFRGCQKNDYSLKQVVKILTVNKTTTQRSSLTFFEVRNIQFLRCVWNITSLSFLTLILSLSIPFFITFGVQSVSPLWIQTLSFSTSPFCRYPWLAGIIHAKTSPTESMFSAVFLLQLRCRWKGGRK